MARFIPRIYINKDTINSLEKETIIQFSGNIFHYIKNVLRMKIQSEILIFDGFNGEWITRILEINKKSLNVIIEKQTRLQEKNISDLWLIFAPVKQLDSIIRQTTELGISKFIPIKTKYSIINKFKDERLKNIAIEASEQSERLTIPKFKTLTSLEILLENWQDDRTIIFCDESHKGIHIAKAAMEADTNKKYAILIGPEGGFSDTERETLYNHPFVISVSLGRNILKADTAAISAVSFWENIL